MTSLYDLYREGFLSKLDNTGSASVNSAGSGSSYNDGNKSEAESTCTEGGVIGNQLAADLEGTTADGNRNMQELEVQIDEAVEPVMVGTGSQEDVSICAKRSNSVEESVVATEARHHGACSHVEDEDINVTFSNGSLLESANINCGGSSYESASGESSVHEVDDRTTVLEGNTNDEFDSHDASSEAEEPQESVTETEEVIEQNVNTVAFTEWADGSRQDGDRSWQERASSQSLPEQSGNNIEEQDQVQESHDWPSHDLQEAIDSWLEMPLSEAGESVRDVDTAYFPDDDNVNSMELRELFSRYAI